MSTFERKCSLIKMEIMFWVLVVPLVCLAKIVSKDRKNCSIRNVIFNRRSFFEDQLNNYAARRSMEEIQTIAKLYYCTNFYRKYTKDFPKSSYEI